MHCQIFNEEISEAADLQNRFTDVLNHSPEARYQRSSPVIEEFSGINATTSSVLVAKAETSDTQDKRIL